MNWKPVKGWPGKYAVSRAGQIKNVATGQIHKGLVTPGGHLCVRFYLSSATRFGRRTQRHQVRTIGSIVAEAFLGPRPPNHILRWKNGDRTDCRVQNLHYVPLAAMRPKAPNRHAAHAWH